jgi:amidophosphoribosyltransferase
MCGVLGIVNSKNNAALETYDALIALQHRGQDAAGILTFDGNRYHIRKGDGLVRDIFDSRDMASLKGGIAIGHVRYPTVGAGGVEDAQPFMSHSPFGIAIGHNGNVYNHYQLKKELFNKDKCLVNSDCDVEVILNIFRSSLHKQRVKNLKIENIWKAVKSVYRRAHGGYFVVMYIAGYGMLAFKDPHGIKPGVYGQRKDGISIDHIFASETVALDILGYEVVKDIGAGEAVFIDNDGQVHSKVLQEKSWTPCIFEYIYFARPDTTIDKISVHKARIRMGIKLGKQIKKAKLPIDVVIPVPDSSRSSAYGVSQSLGKPFREGLIKNRYIGRTFIMPNQEARKKSVRYKLNPIPYEIKKKNVLLVDDSIVRGNTSRQIIEMVRKAGAKKVYFASAAPALTHPCLYGVDIPSRKGLIANKLSTKEIERKIGADALFYQKLSDLTESTRSHKSFIKKFCTACFGGKYPTKGINEKTLKENETNYGTIERETDTENDIQPEQLTLV